MLRVYKTPEIKDKWKADAGVLKFAIQNAPTYKPLFFSWGGNNSAVVAFTAVKVDPKKGEISRTVLSTSLIEIDLTNNLYKVVDLALYANLLDECIYYFEIQNDSELYETEPFLVQVDSVLITADLTIITADNDTIYANDKYITI